MPQIARRAARPPRHAGAPPMHDQVHMEGIDILRRQSRLPQRLRSRRRPRRRQPQPAQHSMHVRIDRERRPSPARTAAPPPPSSCPRPAATSATLRLVERHLAQERQVERAATPRDLRQHRLDAQRLRRRQAAGANRVLDLLRTRVGDLLPRSGTCVAVARMPDRSSRPTYSATIRRAPVRRPGRDAAAAAAAPYCAASSSMTSFGVSNSNLRLPPDSITLPLLSLPHSPLYNRLKATQDAPASD